MDGLKLYLRTEEEFGDPMTRLGSLVNSSWFGGRDHNATVAFLKGILNAYHHRATPPLSTKRVLQVLDIYKEYATDAPAQFHPTAIEARCLSWIRSYIFEHEAKVLRSCSVLLNQWVRPEGFSKKKPPLVAHLITPFFIPHALITRLTFDVVQDVANYLVVKGDEHIMHCVQRVVQHSTILSVEYFFGGNLVTYSSNHNLPLPSRVWLEGVMRSEGKVLKDCETLISILNMVSSFNVRQREGDVIDAVSGRVVRGGRRVHFQHLAGGVWP